jgi:RimJ/RimL family protein N-acetyltransferase
MAPSYWPLTGLRLRTPRLELRWPSQDDLESLAELAAEGIHGPGVQPFSAAWTDVPPDERARSVLQFQWSTWAAWKPSAWTLNFVVVTGDRVAGTLGMSGTDFAIRREVDTGSWLGRSHQGQGIGTEMRAAALFLAFEGLGAQQATSGAFTDNAASLGVSRKLGYRDDGVEIHAIRGRPALLRRLRLDRAAWAAGRPAKVEIAGLEPCLPHFGLPA